ncbi:hypothetical protein DFH08DRAFT_505134 [Mycena albidolilacea]|uniref:Uncharacterized protein n=1 Tax=Mycena albidolilacea TaxID=1033008 RepID=A0AAD7AEN4_9AGAR|nr:hypothetical protein DFH08DRAFT_505134 [Mycena albidolilacea]
MLNCNLRANRDPAHVTEVRENLVPRTPDPSAHALAPRSTNYSVSHYAQKTDKCVSGAAIFPHEDQLACVPVFERGVAALRSNGADLILDDLYFKARTRPSGTTLPFPPASDFSFQRKRRVFCEWMNCGCIYQCPGMHLPQDQRFLVLSTLLSFPFAVLHLTPRLLTMTPNNSLYRRNGTLIAIELISLWGWGPQAPHASRQPSFPDPWPSSNADVSRNGVTFASLTPNGIFTPQAWPASLPPTTSVSGAIVVDSLPGTLCDGFQCAGGEKSQGIFPEDSSAVPSRETDTGNELCNQYADGDSSEEDPVVSREVDGGDEKGQEFVLHWLARVEPPENSSTPPVSSSSFERGFIPGTAMSHLMRLGLVDPLTLVQYTNL